MSKRTRLSTIVWPLAIALGFGLLFALFSAFHVGERLELLTFDSRMRLRGEVSGHPDIVLLNVDDETLSAVGEFPIPRRHYERALALLTDHGARAVVFDIVLAEEQTSTGAAAREEAVERIRKLPVAGRTDEAVRAALDRALSGAEDDLAKRARAYGWAFFPAFAAEEENAEASESDGASAMERLVGRGVGAHIGRAESVRRHERVLRVAQDAYVTLQEDPAFLDRWLEASDRERPRLRRELAERYARRFGRPASEITARAAELIGRIHDRNELALAARALAEEDVVAFVEEGRGAPVETLARAGIRSMARLRRLRGLLGARHEEKLLRQYAADAQVSDLHTYARDLYGRHRWYLQTALSGDERFFAALRPFDTRDREALQAVCRTIETETAAVAVADQPPLRTARALVERALERADRAPNELEISPEVRARALVLRERADESCRWETLARAYPELDERIRHGVFLDRAPVAPPGADALPHVWSVRLPVMALAETTRAIPAVNLTVDPDGTVRRLPTFLVYHDPDRASEPGPDADARERDGRLIGSLFLDAGLAILGVPAESVRWEKNALVLPAARLPDAGPPRDIRIPTDERGAMMLNWCGPWGRAFRNESLHKLTRVDETGKFTPEAQALAESLRGKIVLVGLTATGTHDFNPTPFQERYPMVGAHANALDTLLRERFIRPASAALNAALVLAAALVTGFLAGHLRGIRAAGGVLLLGVGYFAAACILQASNGLWINVFHVEAAVLGTFVGVLLYVYMVEERGRREARQVLVHYLAPQVVDEALVNVRDIRQLGGQDELTVWFSDIRGFSAISERVKDPERLIHMMRLYFDALCAPLSDGRAVIDKFIGDAIVAFWNAVPKVENHAVAACLAALKARAAERELNKRLAEMAYIDPIFTRIGINTGRVFYGNMGSTHKLNYSVLGDAVNVASRLEGANKIYGTTILIGERTREMAGRLVVARPIDRLRVVGRTAPVTVHELLGMPGTPLGPIGDALSAYEAGFKAYSAREWGEARKHFQKVLTVCTDDGPSQLYVTRCARFIEMPPPPDWDGVYEAKEK